jgi:hypothetical protein
VARRAAVIGASQESADKERPMVLKRIALALGIVLLGAAFLAGYWPEHRRNQALEASLATLGQELTAARAELGVARLLGELLNVTQLVSQQDFGQAQAMCSRFFDGVRAEAAANPDTRFRDALAAILQLRDSVTAGLTRADPTTIVTLSEIQQRLRAALRYPVPSAPPSGATGT